MRAPAMGPILAILLLVLLAPAHAQKVLLTPNNKGVTAEYHLDQPTSHMTFADQGTVRKDWQTLSANISLKEGSIKSVTPIRNFSVMLHPDSTEDGRGYISLMRIGKGYVVYTPALAARYKKLSLNFKISPGWTIKPLSYINGYLYIGPKSSITSGYGNALHIVAPKQDNPLTETVVRAFDKALAFFTSYFGKLPHQPIMSVTLSGPGPMLLRGDVTDSGMVLVRFHRVKGKSPDTSALATRVAFHETSHLWNSHFARPDEGSPWLHEGGAEYLALVGLATTGGISQAGALSALSQRLSDCRTTVGEQPNISKIISQGSAVYDCGTVIQWLIDMELRRQGMHAGVVDVWANLISRARKGQPKYNPSDFLRLISPSSAAAVFLTGAPKARWPAIEEALASAGVTWRNIPSSESLMVAALRHLNAQVCPPSASKGMSWRDGYVELENDASCGLLAGNIPLYSIQGHNVLKDTSAMFEEVQRFCENRKNISVITLNPRITISIPCKSSLVKPIYYKLTRAPKVSR